MNKMAMNELNRIIADFSPDVALTPAIRDHRRSRILQLEAALHSVEGSFGVEEINRDKLTHHFAGGVYGRELFIPANTMIVSKIHRAKTLNIIAQGVISVISEQGIHTYQAPHVFVSEPFTKRVVISHEDTLWVTAHGTYETDLLKVEDAVIAKDFTELEGAT